MEYEKIEICAASRPLGGFGVTSSSISSMCMCEFRWGTVVIIRQGERGRVERIRFGVSEWLNVRDVVSLQTSIITDVFPWR